MTTTEAKQLLAQRDELDKEIATQMEILQVNNVDMKTELVDEEGFPRSDIDVYSVRHARAAIIRLRNDRDALTDKIGSAIIDIHEKSSTDDQNMETEPKKIVHRTSNDPFVKVSAVTPGSPSDLAGLKSGDLVIQFDTVHAGNFTELKQLAASANENEGKVIRVTIIRDGHPVRIELRPRRWSPDPKIGLLGCALLPVPKQSS